MTEKELQQNAAPVFDANPEADRLIATSDGHYFLPAAESLAKDHARRQGAKLFTIYRDPAQAANTSAPALTAEQVRQWAEANDNLDELNAAAQTIEARITTLSENKSDPAKMTAAELEAWAATITEAAQLETALALVKTKKGKEVIEARIAQLKTPGA